MEREADLDGRVVLITGASAGLGRALALAFAGAGARIGICARGADTLAETARTVRDRGADCVSSAADVRSEDGLRAWVQRVEDRLGPPAVLINNASLLGPKEPLARHSTADWDAVIDVNLNGAFRATRLVLPGMLERGDGSILNVGSGAAKLPRTGWGAYSVAKHALEGLSMNLAAELSGTGVRVNVVDPGAIRTTMRAAAYPHEDPATVKPPDSVAPLFLWLAADAGRRVTGERFQADEWLAGGR
jgi:NAD(P)-dependent dehydrogenase (short-subunit alcohol dehydrogenase family)